MDAKLKPSFWTDHRIEDLSHEEKLAALWLVSNPSRDLMGFTQVSRRRFILETGLEDLSPLEGACKALPTSFVRLDANTYFARNFVRHQFGKGGAISAKNNVVVAICRQAATLPSALKSAFYEAYPELCTDENDEAPCKGLIRGSQGDPQAPEKSREENRRVEKSREEHKKPEPAELEAIAMAHPRRVMSQPVIAAIRASVKRYGAERVLEGAKAYAAAVQEWTPAERQTYVMGPERFFAEDWWNQPAENWKSRIKSKAEAGKEAASATKADVGGRKPSQIIS